MRVGDCNVRTLQKVEVVHSVAVLHDVLLDLGRIHPSHKVLHVPEQQKSAYTLSAINDNRISPRNQKRRVGHNLSSNPNMALLDELIGSADMLRHSQPSHDNPQSTSAKSRHSDFPLDITELALSATTNAEQAHVVELLEQLVLLLAAELALWGQQSNTVREMAQLAGQTVVRAVVVGVGERVAADDFCAAVAGIRRVVGEVDFAQELLLVVLELADHDCGCVTEIGTLLSAMSWRSRRDFKVRYAKGCPKLSRTRKARRVPSNFWEALGPPSISPSLCALTQLG